MEWIYYIVIAYWVLNSIWKALKKNQMTPEAKAELIKKLNVKLASQNVVEPQPVYEKSLRQIVRAAQSDPEDVFSIFREKPTEEKVFVEEEEEYDAAPPAFVRDEVSEQRSHFGGDQSTGSHFKLGKGITTALGDMSHMPKGMGLMKSVNFDVYHQKAVVKPIVKVDASALKKFFIIGEIFGKPKALRK